MKRFDICLFALLAVIIIACKSGPPAVDPYPAAEEEEVFEQVEEDVPVADFTVSQEVYDFTLAEVKLFVEDLNAMILKKDYNSWKDALSDEFFARISSKEFLASASQSSMLKSRKVVLKSPNDYFLQVVVPSRSNSKVDEIAFTAADRVKVFYLEERVRRNENSAPTTEFRRLRLYDLVKIDGTWKIID